MVKPVSGQFLSSLFLVPKRDGNSRPVINLKELNVFLKYDHFKMEGIHLLCDLLQPQDWLGKIDLKNAYFMIPVWKDHRKYLQFVWKGSLLEFACLPFGLAAAPRLFTKVLKPVVALLRRAAVCLIIYLDDLLFMNQSKDGLGLDMATARYLLENLGFVINLEKSCFVPTQSMEFLGFVVNTQAMTLLLSNSKVESIKSHCNYLLALPKVSVRDLSQLIGKLTASIQAIFPAPLHYLHLQHLKHQALALRKGYDATIPLSIEAREKLHWWLAHLNAWNGRALLHPPPDIVIEMDASRIGWGPYARGCKPGVMVSDGEKASHQLLGTPSRSLRCQEFHKKLLMCPCEASHGQHFGCDVCKSPRGDSLPSSVQSSSGSVGMGTQAGFLFQRRTPIRPPEYRSGLAISELP